MTPTPHVTAHEQVIRDEKAAEKVHQKAQHVAPAPRVEIKPAPVPKAPRFSREGVLLNPEDCHVGADGVVVGRN